jgi:toxin ParE1/3/4
MDLAFKDDLDQTLIQVRTHPEAFPIVHTNIRRAILSRFPFGVFYARRADHVFVLGVVHHSRDPSRWKSRG